MVNGIFMYSTLATELTDLAIPVETVEACVIVLPFFLGFVPGALRQCTLRVAAFIDWFYLNRWLLQCVTCMRGKEVEGFGKHGLLYLD